MRSQSISPSLSCGQSRALLATAAFAWLFASGMDIPPPWSHLLLGRLCCGPGSGQMAWLLAFGDSVIPLGSAALEGCWLPVLINFGSCFLIPVWLFSLSSPLWPILCIKFSVFEILEWFQFS